VETLMMLENAGRSGIVGAGAMGVAVAHHLRQPRIDVDFMVRHARVSETPYRYRLYSYQPRGSSCRARCGFRRKPAGDSDLKSATIPT